MGMCLLFALSFLAGLRAGARLYVSAWLHAGAWLNAMWVCLTSVTPACSPPGTDLLLQNVFTQSFRESRFPHKSINLSFIITNTKNKLTDLRREPLLQNDLINTFCELGSAPGRVGVFSASVLMPASRLSFHADLHAHETDSCPPCRGLGAEMAQSQSCIVSCLTSRLLWKLGLGGVGERGRGGKRLQGRS